jgi:hypothetical protein
MAPKPPPAEPLPLSANGGAQYGNLYAKAAVFINGLDIPGHGVLSSVSVERHKDLSLAVVEFGLLVTGQGRQTLIPFPNVKAIYL